MDNLNGNLYEWADVRLLVGGKLVNDAEPKKLTFADIERMRIQLTILDARRPKPAKKIRAGSLLYRRIIDSTPTAKLPVDGLPFRLQEIPFECDFDLKDNDYEIDE